MEQNYFHWSDYLTFAIMLLVSAVIGLAFSKKSKAKSAGGLFVGNRKMTLLPVTMSAFATFMSAVAILGGPLEVYYNGMAYAYLNSVSIISSSISCFVFVPFFYRLGYVSIYEYIRRRFNGKVSTMAALISQTGLFLYTSVVLYAPSSAISQISGLSLWITIPCVGCVCTLYTAFGGLQGVMWTDVWQSAFMFAGLIAIVIVGTINVGGADKVIEAALQGGRLSSYIDTSFNPFIRHSVLSVIIGGVFFKSGMVSSQPMFQRIISCKNLRTAQYSIWLRTLVHLAFELLVYATGLVAFAYFTCDPLLTKEIRKTEHLVPYTVMKTMAIPGVTGLFLASTFSGSLSTVSSCINSITMVIIVDLVNPIRRHTGRQALSEKKMANLSKVIAAILGVLMIGLAFLCDRLSTLIVQITMSISGMSAGPCFGVVLAGVFLPFVNSTGALSGFIVSAAFSITVCIGSAISGITSYSRKLPLSKHGCPNGTASGNLTTTTVSPDWLWNEWNSTLDYNDNDNYNFNYTSWTTPSSSTSTATATPDSFRITDIFRLSYLLYCITASLIFLVVAISVSLCTNCNKKHPVDPRLIYWTRQKSDEQKVAADSKLRDEEDDTFIPLNGESKH